MKGMLTYEGYFGSVHYNDHDQIFYGKLEFIHALVSYEGTDVKSLRRSFEEAVDDYLKLCQQTKRVPEKPFKGSFNIRLNSDLHHQLYEKATKKGMTLNGFIKSVLEKVVAETRRA